MGGTALSTGVGGDPPATGAATEGYAAAAADGFCHKLAVEGGASFGQKNRPTKPEEEAGEERAMGFSVGVPNFLDASAAPKLSRFSGIGNDAGETAALSNLFDEAERQEDDELVAVGGKEASPTGEQDQEQKQDRGEGEPTQVLCVPDIATRDTEEFLGIQVRSGHEVDATAFI